MASTRATLLHECFSPQAAEGDRPARHRHRRDAVLPLVPRFAAQMVNRSGSQLGGGAVEASSPAPAESHRRGGTERDADNMLEHRTITMPADPGARIVPNQQRLNQILRGYMCEPRRLRTQRQQPRGKRLGRSEARRVEIVAPAIRGGQAFSGPSVEAERRQFRRVDRRDQGLFLARCDDTLRLRQTRERQAVRTNQIARQTCPSIARAPRSAVSADGVLFLFAA